MVNAPAQSFSLVSNSSFILDIKSLDWPLNETKVENYIDPFERTKHEWLVLSKKTA